MTFTDRQAIAFRAYQWLMIRSSEVDAWAGCGLWKHGDSAE